MEELGMEELERKKEELQKALLTLKDALIIIDDPSYRSLPLGGKIYTGLRDSIIQRFEYTFDSFWKFLKLYLIQKLYIDIEISSPRSVLREALNNGVITSQQFEILIDSVADRNLTSHTYKEALAQEIMMHAVAYYEVMQEILNKMDMM